MPQFQFTYTLSSIHHKPSFRFPRSILNRASLTWCCTVMSEAECIEVLHRSVVPQQPPTRLLGNRLRSIARRRLGPKPSVHAVIMWMCSLTGGTWL